MAVTTFSERTQSDYHIQNFIDYASRTPNVSFAYGNGGTAGNPGSAFSDARTIAIRGIAGARTSGFYIDDTPLPGAVDVRLLDVASVEILKGPQGTLFGESSLGGNVRLISKAPNLQKNEGRYAFEGSSMRGAGQGGSAEAVANLVLSENAAALRMVAFADDAPGYLARSYRADIANAQSARVTVDGQGAMRSLGGSLGLLLRASSALDLNLRLAYQNQFTFGFPASYAPLPAFMPLSTVEHDTNVQPEASDIWTLPSLSVTYHGSGWTLSSSTSRFERRTHDLEDSTEGTAAYWGSTIVQSYPWSAHHHSTQLAHETRVGFEGGAAWSGTFGLYYSQHRAEFGIDDIYAQLGATAGVPSLIWRQRDVNIQRDTALFGELYYRFADKFTLTAGTRKYWLKQSDDLGFAYLSTVFRSASENSASGMSPKLALAYQHSAQAMLYASAAKGFRQGNAQFDASGFGCDASLAAIGQTPKSMTRIEPDAVWSYEAGAKLDLPQPGLLLTASLFRVNWDHIQQPIFLPSCAFYMQGNAGAATIDGVEFELAGRLSPSLKIRAGAGYEDARITKGGNTGQPVGSPVYQVPRLTASLGLVYEAALGAALNGYLEGDLSHAGSSVSANSGADLQLLRPAYALLNLRAGLRWARSELAFGIKNAANAMPNLGDIAYIGYQRSVAGTSTPLPQVVTLAPRTFSLQYRRAF